MRPPAPVAERRPPVAAPTPTRAQRLLQEPPLKALLRLSTPTATLSAVQIGVVAIEIGLISRLGADALAGAALVFPVVTLMNAILSGGMGAGVASATARALGAGRREDASATAIQAVGVGLVTGGVFALMMLTGGQALYQAMGGGGATLQLALAYSNVVFGAAVVSCLSQMLGSVVRGTGNTVVPAVAVVGASLLHLALAPSLMFGWMFFPRWGLAGLGVSSVTAGTCGVLVLVGYLLSRRSPVRLTLTGAAARTDTLWQIMRVGAPTTVNTIIYNGSMTLLTGLVGQFGSHALAGFGTATRLDHILRLLVFSLGSSIAVLTGTAVGARDYARARRVAWTGVGVAAAISEAVGLSVAAAPWLWLGLFDVDAEVAAAGTSYLRIAGPTYGFATLVVALYFASQGFARLTWPFIASLGRVGLALAVAWLGVRVFEGGLSIVFVAIALSNVVGAALLTTAIRRGAWKSARTS